MAGYVIPVFQNILLICFLPGAVMMDDIGYAVPVPPVRDNPDMVLKDDDVPSLSFLYGGNICGEAESGVRKINLQVPDAPEIDMDIRLLNVIIIWVCLNIRLD